MRGGRCTRALKFVVGRKLLSRGKSTGQDILYRVARQLHACHAVDVAVHSKSTIPMWSIKAGIYLNGLREPHTNKDDNMGRLETISPLVQVFEQLEIHDASRTRSGLQLGDSLRTRTTLPSVPMQKFNREVQPKTEL